MIEFLVTGLILLGCLFVYKCIVQPKATIENYVKIFESHGYKVYRVPYKCLGAPAFETMIDPTAKDALELSKYKYPGSDVAISNVVNKPMI